MLGTAFPASRLLLVEQPGPWGRAALLQSHLDHAVAVALQGRANRAGVRIEMIRRPGRTATGAQRHWALVDTRRDRQSVRWGSIVQDAELLDIALDSAPSGAGTPDEQPLYLVCAHGKHDPCCALRGRPVAVALDARRPGRVWECSHLGGDRFAANVLVLPSGLLYGRVRVADAERFTAAADAGEVLVDQLRGRIGLQPAAQAALAFGYAHCAAPAHDALRVIATRPAADGASLVTVDAPSGRLDVLVRVERVAASGLTCANPRPNYYLAYFPESFHS